MQAGAERHLGIRGSISGFVVQEDQTLLARGRQEWARLNAGFQKAIDAASSTSVSLPPVQMPEPMSYILRRIPRFLVRARRFHRQCQRINQAVRAALGIFWRSMQPLVEGLGQMRLLAALVRHCWNDAHCLPAPLVGTGRWWLRPVLSFPVGLILAGFVLYCAAPVLETRALVTPPITIRATLAEAGINQAEPGQENTEPDHTGTVEITPIPEAPPPPELPWHTVNRAFPSFNLQNPDADGMEMAYTVFSRGRYHRRESMTWLPGAKHPEGRRGGRIMLTMDRFEQDVPSIKPFEVDVHLRAEQDHMLIERLSPRTFLPTKFGATEVADGVLATPDGLSSCLFFRHHEHMGFIVAGWFCGSPRKPVDRVSLTCFIDRLDLIQAGQDHALRQLFAAAERNRTYTPTQCGSSRLPGRRMTWLDHEAPMPSLKLSTRDGERGRK
jgi:hypothetical protein